MGASKRPGSGANPISYSSCSHLAGLTRAKRTKLAESIWSSIDDSETKEFCTRDPNARFHCITCNKTAASPADHVAAHSFLKRGHELILDRFVNEIYCTVCEDYIYSSDIDSTLTAFHASKIINDDAQAPANNNDTAVEQPIQDEALLEPGLPDLLIADPAKLFSLPNPPPSEPAPIEPLSTNSQYPPGLRGLNNMGHTCFMNSILQALLHTPLLREHHLSNGHNLSTCPISSSDGFCVACEMDTIFSAAYDGLQSPYSPAAFLHTWWMLAGGALGGGCKQQDAHEFFLFILEMLVASTGKDSLPSKLFSGTLRSDVICAACGAASTTRDDFTHVSLDIPPSTALIAPSILPRPNANSINGKVGAAAANKNKGSKHLVGAAKAAHLAKISRNNRRTSEPTPEETSSQPLLEQGEVDGDSFSGLESSMWTAAGAPRPILQTNVTMAEVKDTLTSTRRGSRSGFATSRSPSATGMQDVLAAETNIVGTETQAALVGSQGAASHASHSALAGYLRWPGASLGGCLRRFVWPETLGAGEAWSCPCCGANCNAVKQMSLERLPPVMVMHAKRFEHTGGARASAKKLETFLSFPVDDLDMKPYLSAQALQQRCIPRRPGASLGSPSAVGLAGTPNSRIGSAKSLPRPGSAAALGNNPSTGITRRTRSATNSIQLEYTPRSPITRSASIATAGLVGSDGRWTGKASRLAAAAAAAVIEVDTNDSLVAGQADNDTLYDLFAVVCHRGTFQGGHYITYIKASNGQWYLCDDAFIGPVTEDAVRNSQAYMLFYGQKKLLPWNNMEGK